ncbi:MAG: WG repeat-containing protein [Alistipes onderdonkii]
MPKISTMPAGAISPRTVSWSCRSSTTRPIRSAADWRVSSSRARVRYIDRQGNEVVPCKYQEAEDFHDFRAKVKQYDRVLTIDETGQIVEQ